MNPCRADPLETHVETDKRAMNSPESPLPPAPSAPATSIGRWVAAARPKTLLLAVSPVLAGIGLAMAETATLAPMIALATLLAATAIQVGTNLHNDAADYERGTDTENRLGPPRASAQGWFTSAQVRQAAHMAFALAFLLGCLLVVRGGWQILAIGLASLACGYVYTSGPRPIAYGPWGEAFVLAFFGIAAVAGSHYLQTLQWGWNAVLLGCALGLPAAAVLLLNNDRDLETDRAAGRRTLSQYIGRRGSRLLYAVLVLLPFPLILAAGLHGPTWITLAALPLALLLISRLLAGASGVAMNRLLAQTSMLQGTITFLLLCAFGLDAGA